MMKELLVLLVLLVLLCSPSWVAPRPLEEAAALQDDSELLAALPPPLRELMTTADGIQDPDGLRGAIRDVEADVRHPVLFIPGLLGSQLELDASGRELSPNVLCKRFRKGWEHAWLPSLWQLLPFELDCWRSNMSLRWNNNTAEVEPLEHGVAVRPIASYEAVVQLDPKVPVFNWFEDALKELNYQPGTNIASFAYDWRVGPETWSKADGAFDQLKRKIERLVADNDDIPIVPLSISLGGPFFALFLSSHVDKGWKERHIFAWVSLSGVMGGSSFAPASVVNEELWHQMYQTVPEYTCRRMREAFITFPSMTWLFPSAGTFNSTTIIETPKRRFSSENFDEMLRGVQLTEQADMWTRNRGLLGAPDVATFCLSASGTPTPLKYTFQEDDFSGDSRVTVGDGDGTVLLESLRECDGWSRYQEAPVYPVHLVNVTHSGILGNVDAIRILLGVATAGALPPPPRESGILYQLLEQ